jgi:hypothetical protein
MTRRIPAVCVAFVLLGTPWADVAVAATRLSAEQGNTDCARGFRWNGQECVAINVPPNARLDVFGSGWTCNRGYKQVQSRCTEMTPEEQVAQQRMIATALARASARSATISADGNEFTLSDVARRCEAYVYSNPYGELECRGNVRILGRRCEVYIYSWPDGQIDCRGSELREVERRCSVYMYSDQYGDVSC